jgi:hypothetical protein
MAYEELFTDLLKADSKIRRLVSVVNGRQRLKHHSHPSCRAS